MTSSENLVLIQDYSLNPMLCPTPFKVLLLFLLVLSGLNCGVMGDVWTGSLLLLHRSGHWLVCACIRPSLRVAACALIDGEGNPTSAQLFLSFPCYSCMVI